MNEDKIPRWQQGIRPNAFGDVWDGMKPGERRRAFFSDIVVAIVGALLLIFLFGCRHA